jgi:hypothetical protein
MVLLLTWPPVGLSRPYDTPAARQQSASFASLAGDRRMTREQSLQIIRDAFSHIEVERIVVEFDPLLEEDVAKVYVKEDELDGALGADGFYPRGVAIKAGLAIEVVLSNK